MDWSRVRESVVGDGEQMRADDLCVYQVEV